MTAIKIKLHDYQEQALAAEQEHRVGNPAETRLAIVMATGLGKTMVGAERAIRHLDSFEGAGNRVLILVHTDELTQQFEKRARLMAQSRPTVDGAVFSVGVIKADRDEFEADIVIGSVQTLARLERRERLRDVGLVIVDECHHAAAASYQVILRHFGCLVDVTGIGRSEPEYLSGATPVLGLTATLERGDGQGLGTIWQDVAFSRDISWGVRRGRLVQPIGYRLEIPLNGSEMGGATHFTSGSAEALDIQLMESLAPERIVEKWQELASDRPTVAFMPLVRSARMLSLAFHDAGVKASVIHGDMPGWQRRADLAAYERGETQVLVNAMVLTEGWDSPRTKCVIIGRPTKSRALFVQMAGRGLRPVPGIPVEEQDCILLCVADSTTDLCSIADLSDRPLDRMVQGALTAMEDQWDIGAELDAAPDHVWSGHVDAEKFDPLVRRSSKVWRTTQQTGTPFLPIGKAGQYVFVVGTSVFVREDAGPRFHTQRLHKDLPDLELALSAAEDEAQERGGDIGRLLADRDRPWRKAVPSADMVALAQRLGLGKELIGIMEQRAGGKAGKLSDLIGRVEATRALEPLVARIREAIR